MGLHSSEAIDELIFSHFILTCFIYSTDANTQCPSLLKWTENQRDQKKPRETWEDHVKLYIHSAIDSLKKLN